VLQSRPAGARGEDAGYWRDLQVDALLLELADAMVARQEPLGAPFDRLPTGDPHQIATLRAYLDRFGDVAAAAADVFVHPNTFRYRLRKLSERAELNLDDPDTRFALMLQLRLQEHREPAATRPGPPSTVGA
jgi:DNA-binding PucR family transcriptional regulator